MNMDIQKKSLEIHEKLKGKLEIKSKIPLKSIEDLSLAYTPGVAEVCREITKDKSLIYKYTFKENTVAVISDGSAVLGLGNIGPEAALPVMEGKCVLFKEFAGINAFPICLSKQDIKTTIETIKNISVVFGGINLEDFKAPECFEIEEGLQNLGIPVMHDDQHGTAVVVLAALINSLKIRGLAKEKELIAELTNLDCIIDTNFKSCLKGDLKNALKNADIFIGVSKGNLLTKEMIGSMNKNPIIFALANPNPEIMPDLAKEAGAFIVGTGRSDFPNQINNVLAFPGIFRGALDIKAKRITDKMKIAAAEALASVIKPSVDKILPSPFDKEIVPRIADAVKEAYQE